MRRRLRRTNIAQIGRPYPGMMDLYIDETNLYNRLASTPSSLTGEMWAIADNIDGPGCRGCQGRRDSRHLRRRAAPVTDEPIQEMAKYVVAFEQWVKDEEIGLSCH